MSSKCCVCGVQGEPLEPTTKGPMCWGCIEEPHLDDSKED